MPTTCHLSFLGCLTAFTAEDELTVEVHQATELHLAQLLLIQPVSLEEHPTASTDTVIYLQLDMGAAGKHST